MSFRYLPANTCHSLHDPGPTRRVGVGARGEEVGVTTGLATMMGFFGATML